MLSVAWLSQELLAGTAKMLWSSSTYLVKVYLQPSRDTHVADLLRVPETSPKVRGG
jgi:hypothetical protein